MDSDNKDKELTAREQKLLEVARTLRPAFTRKLLAEALGQRQLTPWDKQLLERLVVRGYLEVEEGQVKNLVRRVYRVPDEPGEPPTR